jgi:Tol biopolymer transport system component
MPRCFPAALVFLLAACAAPAPVVAPAPTPEIPSGPAFGSLVVSEGRLVVQAEESLPVGQVGIERVDQVFPGGQAGAVLFSIGTRDSTLLMKAQQGEVTRIHGVNGASVYTVAWSPDGTQAAFGHYRSRGEASPGRPRMGAGDILLYDGADVSRVGCSASRAVLGWAANGQLLVRNTDNLYLIERDGCDTVETIDARRMHGLTVSPDAQHLVFVHRELEFDRATRSYVADSTFRMTDLDGQNPRTVVSFKYRPRGFSWRADGTELAFDVMDPNLPGARAISIFDLASGTAAYLHPPTSPESREFAPSWSPSGARMAYRQGASVAVRTFADQFPSVIPGSEGARPMGWLDDETLILRAADGATRVVSLSGGASQRISSGSVIDVWRIR